LGWLNATVPLTFFHRSGVKRPHYSFTIPERDQGGFNVLSAIRDRGLNTLAIATAQSVDHIAEFFATLRRELSFYLGVLNLVDRLARIGQQWCFPDACATEDGVLSAVELCEPCLALRSNGRVVGNTFDADAKDMIVITGANQGGKSTFLRSLGLAQLMMQSGIVVAATSYRASVRSGLFTHFIREEDVKMEHGKLDDELRRMSKLADRIRRGAVLLCNESFASTNEREGAEIASQVVRAMVDAGVRVVYVTHLYDLAQRIMTDHGDRTLFLRAEREEDGRRTFRLSRAEPLPTSFGQDLYRRIFRDLDDTEDSAPRADLVMGTTPGARDA
jgi:DNA mismatch repair ATPase MutS